LGYHAKNGNLLRAGQWQQLSHGGGEIFHICPSMPWDTPSHLNSGKWVFPWCSAARVWKPPNSVGHQG